MDKPKRHCSLQNQITVLALLASASADTEWYTIGMDYRNRTDWHGLDNLSLMGGVPVYIKVQGGLDMQAQLNTVGIASKNIPKAQFSQSTINDDDAINSNPAAGLLGWTIPSAMDIFSTPAYKATYFDFHSLPTGFPGAYPSLNGGVDYLTFQIQVSSTGQVLSCMSDLNCHFAYNQRFTPQLLDTAPNQVYAGQQINFWVNPGLIFAKLPADWEPFYYLKLGGYHTDWEGLIDVKTRLTNNRWQVVPTVVGEGIPATQNADPDINFSMFGRTFLRSTARHCNFAGDECWTVKIHPTIQSISHATGYVDGGQMLVITGQGLSGNLIEVTVDGVPCTVEYTLSDANQLTCETQSKGTLSMINFAQPGHHGATRTVFDPLQTATEFQCEEFTKDQYPAKNQSLVTTLETTTIFQDKVAGWRYDGWFLAPRAGEYKFYLSALDEAKLFLDVTAPFNTTTQYAGVISSDSNLVASSLGSDGFRFYDRVPDVSETGNQFQSAWITLTGGSYYKFQVQHINYGGPNYFSAAVEFKDNTSKVGHPQASKAIQNLRIEQIPSNVEQWYLTVLNPSSTNSFVLTLQSPLQSTLWTSPLIYTNDSADVFYSKVAPFFINCARLCGDIKVDLVMFDNNNAATINVNIAVKYAFTVSVMKRLIGFSFTSFSILPAGGVFTGSTSVTLTPPYAGGIQSSAPLAGYFIISCPDPQGKIWTIRPQDFIGNLTRSAEDIQSDFDEDISWLRGKVTIKQYNNGNAANKFRFSYRQNGINLLLIFDGLDFDPPQCTISSSSTNPVTGGTVSFVSVTQRSYGQSLMFEPIGLEFLYTDVVNPQVLVNIDGMPAVCPNLNCDYSYVRASEVISNLQYNPTTNVITITGTNLPMNGFEFTFAGTSCDWSIALSLSPTQISCKLLGDPQAGSHKAEIRVAGGLIPYSTGVLDITIALSVSTVSPSQVSPIGGAILSITGSGFPSESELAKVSFSDGTTCEVLKTSANLITCKVVGFSANDGKNRTITISISNVRYMHGRRELVVQVSDSSLTISCMTNIPKVLSISDTNVSPVLKTEITFQLDSNYQDILYATDLTVFVLAPGYKRQLYVISADDSAKTFKVKFNGAPIGTYTLSVYAASPSQYELLDTSAVSLSTSSTITSISRQQGSCYGGTQLVITGTNFSPVFSDQEIKVGDHYCDISAASETELTCRIRQTGLSSGTYYNNRVLVILWASTQSTCTLLNLCMFTFVPPRENIDKVSSTYNPASQAIEVNVVGSGFSSGSASAISLVLDGLAQTLVSVDSDTSLTFAVTNIAQAATTSIMFFFEDGFPEGYQNIAPLTLTPTWASVTPSIGSMGGTLITVNAPGIGISTTGLNLFDVTANKTICTEVTIIRSGQFTCMTGAFVISPSDSILLTAQQKDSSGTNSQISFPPADIAACSYSQQLDSNTPHVHSASIFGNTIKFLGTNFPTSGFISTASFKHQQVNLDAGWSETQATATFTQGIPASEAGESVLPQLKFTNADGVKYLSYQFQTLEPNTLNFRSIASTSNLHSSYAGGLAYTVSGVPNLLVSLQEPGNSVEVCGNTCVIDLQQSSADSITCTLPSVVTIFSAENYKVKESSKLNGTWSSSNDTSLPNALDGMWTTDFDDLNPNCFLELSFSPGQVGVLDSSKFLLNNLTSTKTPFVKMLKLTGWDGSSWNTVWTADNSIHEGWNTQTFIASAKPAFYKYRWAGTSTGACRLGEVVFIGIVAFKNAASFNVCPVKLNVGSLSVGLNDVTYINSHTPTISSISPRYGSVKGNELITITGTNFVDGQTSVKVDGITCSVQEVTSTKITCLTGSRPGDQPNPSFVVFVEGAGIAVTQGNTFHYVQYWSEPSTWGYDMPPQEGEAVQIPKGRTLLVDVDVVPPLSFVLVQGSLIFAPHADPAHHRSFDAGYIFVEGGYMEVGTDDFPYTSRITITMHGDASSPSLPTYGNKNIAVRGGTLSMIGVTRQVVWTMMDLTSLPGDSQITLLPQAVDTFDWAVGEQIVIASTSFEKDQAELRTIIAVTMDAIDNSKPVLTLDLPLKYKHYAATEKYGSRTVDFRAEVGLLTRNVKFRGDPETSAKNQYGAHIMLHLEGDESCVGRIKYVELTDVGQAFKLGRYPIHFHLIGTVARSIVKGNSIHQTYNRAVAIHVASHLNVIQNVIYNTMGHSIFIEDGIEENNVIDGNLVIKTNRSWGLLNSDQTPASFWITNPLNVVINNHAAGSAHYGFWYDLKAHPSGPSFTFTVCPEMNPLGEFRKNVAHSNGKYGFRGFKRHIPMTYPCQPLVFNPDKTLAGYPYPTNPVVPAVYKDFVSWKNVEIGAIGNRMGAVIWQNFTVADNLKTGLEWSEPDASIALLNMSYIDGAIIIGRSNNTEPILDNSLFVYGMITPRLNDWWAAYNVSFFSFGFTNGFAAIGDCSNCFFADSTDSGARTITTGGLSFDSTVSVRIKYQQPWRGIFHDIDGSLTGLGPDSWAAANFAHNEQPECITNLEMYDGQICDSSVQIRRVVFYNPTPVTILSKHLRVLKYDDSLTSTMSASQLLTYNQNLTAYDAAYMTSFQQPGLSWALPYVTGHKYRFLFDIGKLDFTKIQVQTSVRWQPTDKYVEFNYPYVGNYEDYDFFTQLGYKFNQTGYLNYFLPEGSLSPQTRSSWLTGYNSLDITAHELNFAITGAQGSSQNLQINAVTCRQNLASWCNLNPAVVTCPATSKLWSDPATWGGSVPSAGANVTIPSGQTIMFDLEESPIYNLITIDGCLQFLTDSSKDQHLKAHLIYVHSGSFTIGTSSVPYARKAIITLYGDVDSPTVTFGNNIQAGNKGIFNNGYISFFGSMRSAASYMSRLTAVAQKGDTSIYVAPGLDWLTGEQIGIAASGSEWTHSEHATITSYDAASGEVVLADPLQYYHFGAADSTGLNYQGLDMRCEVVMFNRNIVIQGDNTQSGWQAQLVTSDALQIDSSGNQVALQGLTILQNVEFFYMGQNNTEFAAIRFEQSNMADGLAQYSSISHCSIHNSGSWAILVRNSQNVHFANTFVFTARQIGIVVDIVTSVHFDHVNVFNVQRKPLLDLSVSDKEACVAHCSINEFSPCYKSSFTNSILAGCPFAGIVAHGYSCNDPVGASTTTFIKNITVHSNFGSGAMMIPDPAISSDQLQCYQFDHIYAYKNVEAGIGTMYNTYEMRVSDVVMVDNTQGISLNTAEGVVGGFCQDMKIKLSNSFIYGELDDLHDDCPDGTTGTTGATCYCPDKFGFMNAYSEQQGKDAHICETSKRPVYNTITDACWNSVALIDNVTFINFKPTTKCNSRQSAIGFASEYSPDYVPLHFFTNTKFVNVDPQAIAYLRDPPLNWAGINDCGAWPCTGPSNSLFNFYDSVWQVNDTITQLPSFWTAGMTSFDFQIVGKVTTAGDTYSECEFSSQMNAYFCAPVNQTKPFDIALLEFESLDSDKQTRSTQPVVISNLATGYLNTLNAFMDHGWDVFYTSAQRLQRFVATVQTGQIYTVTYTGTPPNNMRYALRADVCSQSIIVRVPYPNAGSFGVAVAGQIISPVGWNTETQQRLQIDPENAVCGTNRFLGVVNILEFFLTPNCTVNVFPQDAILSTVRLRWTSSQFFNGNGVTTFVQRMASVLVITPDRINVVAVYEGSLNVLFFIDQETSTIHFNQDGSVKPSQIAYLDLTKLQEQLKYMIGEGNTNLGAPVIELSSTIQTQVVINSDTQPGSSSQCDLCYSVPASQLAVKISASLLLMFVAMVTMF